MDRVRFFDQAIDCCALHQQAAWLLDHRHPLYVLAKAIRLEFFEPEFGALYVERKGRPGLPIRLLVRIHVSCCSKTLHLRAKPVGMIST